MNLDGELLIGEAKTKRTPRVKLVLPMFTVNLKIVILSADADRLYVFNEAGRDLFTLDRHRTGAMLDMFS